MSKKYSIQYDTERLNPEFIGISERYSKKKKERKEIQTRKHHLQQSVNHVQRVKESIDSTLKRKKDQLMYLKEVRARHLSDIKHKQDVEQRDRRIMEQLRMRSSNARVTHQQNLQDAIYSKKRQKLKAKQEVLDQLGDIKKLREQHQLQMKELFEARAREQEEQKSCRSSRINNFYRKKNKFVLKNYRTLLQDQELQSSQSKNEIVFLETQTQKLGENVSKKKNKLKSIQDEISLLKTEERSIKGLNSYQWGSMDGSRVSKLSSRPSEVLKQTFSITATVRGSQQ